MNTTIFSPCQIHYRVNQPPARQNNAKLIECISRKCPTMHGIAAQDSFSKQILMNPTSPSCFCWSQCYNIHMCQIDYISLLYERMSVRNYYVATRACRIPSQSYLYASDGCFVSAESYSQPTSVYACHTL